MTTARRSAVPPRKVELGIDMRGQGSVVIDDVDISHVVRGVSVVSVVGEVPVLELELLAGVKGEFLGHLAVDEATYDLLLRTGWTPPPWLALRRHLGGSP